MAGDITPSTKKGTKSMTTHTKTPWRQRQKPFEIEGRDNGNCWVLRATAYGRTDVESDANARFIIQAVNNFDELLAALSDIAAFAEQHPNGCTPYGVSVIANKARAAIEKAEAQP